MQRIPSPALAEVTPELLEVARKIVRLCEAFGTYGDPAGEFEAFENVVADANAAIAKATAASLDRQRAA